MSLFPKKKWTIPLNYDTFSHVTHIAPIEIHVHTISLVDTFILCSNWLAIAILWQNDMDFQAVTDKTTVYVNRMISSAGVNAHEAYFKGY